MASKIGKNQPNFAIFLSQKSGHPSVSKNKEKFVNQREKVLGGGRFFSTTTSKGFEKILCPFLGLVAGCDKERK